MLESQDVCTDFLQAAEGLRLVKVAGEADLVANLGGVRIDPGIRRVRQHLALHEGVDILRQGNLLRIAEIGVGFVLDDSSLALEKSKQRIEGRLA